MSQFPELNVDHLIKIAKRWIDQYARMRVVFKSITLHRYDSNPLKKRNFLKYAILFDISHYQISENLSGVEGSEFFTDLALGWSKLISDPYLWFILNTKFLSDSDKGLPDAFQRNDFGLVYDPPLRDDFEKDWLIVPVFKGVTIPQEVQINEDQVTLYDGTKSADPTGNYTKRQADDLQKEFMQTRERLQRGEMTLEDLWCIDLPLPDEPIVVESKRNEVVEKVAWDKKIKPIVDRCYNSEFQYTLFPEPREITQEDLNSMQEKMIRFCNLVVDPALMFNRVVPENDDYSRNVIEVFDELVLKKLRAGRTIYFENDNHEQVNLEDAFYDFLEELFRKRTLSIFLVSVFHGCGIKEACLSEIPEQDEEKVHTNYFERNCKGGKVTDRATKEALEECLRKISFEYSNNTEIKITVGRNDTRTINAEMLGFDITKGRVAWDILVEILEQPPHKYDCGDTKTIKEKKEYNRKYSILREISKKLVTNFFNKELELNLPYNYKLFESVKGETGVFKFIFKVKDRSTLSLCKSKNDFTYKFTRAYKAARKHPADRNKQQFVIDLIQNAIGNGYLAEVEEKDYWLKAKEAVNCINKIIENEFNKEVEPQPDILPQDPDIKYFENIDNYSD